MTKRRICSIGLIAGLAMMLAGTASALDEKIVFIDLDRVFNEYYKTELADAQLKEQAEEFNEERREMVDDLKKLQEDFNTAREDAQNTALSEEVRNEKRSEAEEKLIELRGYESKIRRLDEARRKQLEDQGRRMRKRIVEGITETINEYSRNQGFTAVIDSSGQSLNGVEIILYTDVKVDVTEDVLEILNRGKQ